MKSEYISSDRILILLSISDRKYKIRITEYWMIRINQIDMTDILYNSTQEQNIQDKVPTKWLFSNAAIISNNKYYYSNYSKYTPWLHRIRLEVTEKCFEKFLNT